MTKASKSVRKNFANNKLRTPQNLADFGLERNVSSEYWHVSAIGT